MPSRIRSEGFTEPIGERYTLGVDVFQIRKREFLPGQFRTETRQITVQPMMVDYATFDWTAITDVVGNKHHVNGCVHFKSGNIKLPKSEIDYESPSSIYTPFLDDQWRNYKVHITGPRGNYPWYQHMGDISFPQDPGFRSIDWSDLIDQVANGMSGAIKARTNILVTLAQIGQTIRMIKNPFGLLNLPVWKRLRFSRASASLLAKEASNIWLEKRYGWDNFRLDLVALGGAWEAAKKHVVYLNSIQHQWHSVHAQQRDTCPFTIPMPDLHFNDGDRYFDLHMTNGRIERVARTQLMVMAGDTMHIMNPMAYALQSCGYCDAVGALWDLVPFSFIVDWFINVQKFVASQPIDWNHFEFQNACHSIKTTYSADFSLSLRTSGHYLDAGYGSQEFPMGNHNVFSKYERFSGLPAEWRATGRTFGGLTLTHLIDVAALMGQRI